MSTQTKVFGKLCTFGVPVILIYFGVSTMLSWPLTSKMPSHRVSFGEKNGKFCEKKLNYMFVKVHKAGSTTTTCILQRFGYENNLTFVLPMKGHSNIGWPKLFKQKDFIPSEDGTFNALVDHVIYNKELLQSILPTDTVYIATLRHPFSHLTSVFNWYHLSKRFHGLDQEHPIKTFLETPKKFEIPFNSKHPRRPFSYTKNFMSFDLGFSLGLSDSQSAIDDFLSRLSKDINLVIILEYYNESLVLLRRMMCWTLKDILYDLKPKNFRTYNKSIENVKRLMGKHRHWSNVDYQLYDYFNATLWHKIKQEGDDFPKEVRHFEKGRKILLDRGANVASTVQLFRETYPGGHDFIIHSFEIDERLAPFFAPYPNHVLHCPTGVSNKDGE
ncbi:PREDICTED: galactose-3-O-sulfotransferase 2-like [Branchiostoma belcheri]|uniref:Galactose-3-O-sulfotransferase 2-like n=1 Tax=Branchiostoma belcheri TaxID=7741 RepID=A0A6P4Y6I3_BRABE|nr:PREDICTED: galactose-3-O-sulfotransferase 2-like [Branchiostoma belcheri]